MDTVVAATVLPVTLQNEPIGRFVTDTDCVICIRSPFLLLINNERVHSGFDETILIKRRGLSGPIQLSGSMVESMRVICFLSPEPQLCFIISEMQKWCVWVLLLIAYSGSSFLSSQEMASAIWRKKTIGLVSSWKMRIVQIHNSSNRCQCSNGEVVVARLYKNERQKCCKQRNNNRLIPRYP